MKKLFVIREKYKVALALLSMIILLLLGVLVERNFLSELNVNSISMFNDRLIPSIAVYHLSDHSTQRMMSTKSYLANEEANKEHALQEFSKHQQKEDSIVRAFEETYLVRDEDSILQLLKSHLDESYRLQQDVLNRKSNHTIADVDGIFEEIRQELQELSKIQTRVGQTLLDQSKVLASKAGVVSQFQVAILIIVCLVAQGFILASKAIAPKIKQKHHLN